MSETYDLEEIEEYEEEYYEEDIESCYDAGLSTIMEGDNESCSSRQSDSLGNAPQSPRKVVPDHITLSSPKSSGQCSPRFALLSPMLFSPMAEARKLKLNSFKSPFGACGRPRSLASPSPGGRSRKSPMITNMPLVLTNLETGEEVIMEGDDDEFTFVSCSDTESIMGASVANSEEMRALNSIPILDESDEPTSPKAPGVANGASQHHSPKKTQHARSNTQQPSKMNFEDTKLRIEHALQRRVKEGKIGPERLDYVRRRLRYDLNRRMFKERMNQCLIPNKRRNGK